MPDEGVEGAEIPQGPETIGLSQFDKLANIFTQRETEGLNVIGWGGDTVALKSSVAEKVLYPTSAIAVVAEGMTRYKREGKPLEDSDSLRDLASGLRDGGLVFPLLDAMDEPQRNDQIRKYIESHGGMYDPNINWQGLIETLATRTDEKAADIDAANA